MTEKMDDLTEKVARAICCSSGACWADHNGGACDWPHKRFAAKVAIRAVLDGIREPDDGMKGVGHMKADAYLDRFGGLSLNDTGAVFAAMIDELRERYD